MIMDQCPICRSGMIGITFIKRLRDPNDPLFAQDICDKFHCTYDDLIEHLTQHEVQTVLREVDGRNREIMSSPDALVNKIAEMVNHIDDYIEYLQMDEDLKYERSMMEMFIKFSDQMTKNIKLLGEFMGRTGQSTQIKQNILVIEQNYACLMGIIKDVDICTECKVKLLDEIDNNNLLMLPAGD